MKRFHIVIIDSGWPTVAHEVLQQSMRTLKGYLSRNNEVIIPPEEKAQDFLRHHPDYMDKDPIIVITDLDPAKIISKAKAKDRAKKNLNGIIIKMGTITDKDDVLRILHEMCRLIGNKKFVSDISWEERRNVLNTVLGGVVENFFSTALRFIA